MVQNNSLWILFSDSTFDSSLKIDFSKLDCKISQVRIAEMCMGSDAKFASLHSLQALALDPSVNSGGP